MHLNNENTNSSTLTRSCSGRMMIRQSMYEQGWGIQVISVLSAWFCHNSETAIKIVFCSNMNKKTLV